jgi:hypothetical protein
VDRGVGAGQLLDDRRFGHVDDRQPVLGPAPRHGLREVVERRLLQWLRHGLAPVNQGDERDLIVRLRQHRVGQQRGQEEHHQHADRDGEGPAFRADARQRAPRQPRHRHDRQRNQQPPRLVEMQRDARDHSAHT